MSIPGINSNGKMAAPFLHEFKKQASFFFKEKIKTARLALTDVTPAQLLAEDATSGNPGAADARTLKTISRAAFEVDDYWRIVEILHKRLAKFDRKNWRVSYKALVVLEHLLTHGPESIAKEFQSDKQVIREMENFQHIDEKGFNWGLNVRKKSQRIVTLLENGTLLKEERNRTRSITRGIEGFGSFSHRTNPAQGVLQESLVKTYERSNSQFNAHGNKEDNIQAQADQGLAKTKSEESQQMNGENINLTFDKKMQISSSWDTFGDQQMLGNINIQMSFKENMSPRKEVLSEDRHEMESAGESNPLLAERNAETRTSVSLEEDHPFNDIEHLRTVSLLLTRDQGLQAC